MKQRILLAGAFLTCLALGTALGARDPLQGVQRQEVAGGVSVLIGRGGNIGVLEGPGGMLIVDGQFEDSAPEIEALLELGTKGRPRYYVNTHHHGDHTGGNAILGRGATRMAHANVRARLTGDEKPEVVLPMVTYEQGLTIHFGGQDIELRHVPGAHTDGDTVVWFHGSNVIHLGDLYFQVGYPFVDVNSGGNVLGMAAGLRDLLAELPDDVRIVPGHGQVTGKTGLAEYVTMLETVIERVRTHLAQGDDLDAMMALGVTQDLDGRWGSFDFVPPRRFVESVVASLR
jgi:cyclase